MRAWEKAVLSVNVRGFTGGKAFRKYVCQHFLKEILYLFIVSCWHLNLLLLSVAEGKWWGFYHCLVSLAFTGWEKWSLALSSAHAPDVSSPWWLWLLCSCYSRDAEGAVWVREPLSPCTWDILALESFCTEKLENRLWLSEMSPAMCMQSVVVCCYRLLNFSWSLKWQFRNTEMEMKEGGVIICIFSVHLSLGICS